MPTTQVIPIGLGAGNAGLTLAAQLLDTAGAPVGPAITTGFAEVGGGYYTLCATLPDGHLGSLKLYDQAQPGTVLGVAAVNPPEPVPLLLSQAVPTTNAPQTLGDCLNAARAEGFGAWRITGTTVTLYAADGVTVVRTFTLNDPLAPTERV